MGHPKTKIIVSFFEGEPNKNSFVITKYINK
jgi:hypothetical protein